MTEMSDTIPSVSIVLCGIIVTRVADGSWEHSCLVLDESSVDGVGGGRLRTL
jgi:hypothetical protein